VSSSAGGNNLLSAIRFVSSVDGSYRFATRVGPYQFLVRKWEPNIITDETFFGSASLDGLSPGADPKTAATYVTNKLEMFDINFNQVTAEIIVPPKVTGPAFMDYTPGVSRIYEVTAGSTVNDVPCFLDRTGPLPGGVSFNIFAFAFLGTPAAGSEGIYRQTFTWECGGPQGRTNSTDFLIRVATPLAFTSSPYLNITTGRPVNFRVTTTGAPKPALTNDQPLPQGLTFQDNNDGTASITGATILPFYLQTCGLGVSWCGVTANNGIQQVQQGLNISLTPHPDPVKITAPARGQSLIFPDGLFTSYLIQTAGGREGSIQIAIEGVGLTGGPQQFPSWLFTRDNGDGTAVVSGFPPFGEHASSMRLAAIVNWCCGLQESEGWTLSVVNEAPRIGFFDSLGFLVGAPGTGKLYSNIQRNSGEIHLAESLPPGLSFSNTYTLADLCIDVYCDTRARIEGTPQPNTGGVYTLRYEATGPSGTGIRDLDLVVYEKPSLSSPNKIAFFAGVPATEVLTALGFPLAPIGPFQNGVGASNGLTFSATSLPAFLKLTSGVNGTPNGTARLTSSATAANIGTYTIPLKMQIDAAPIPSLTNPATQLANTAALTVYIVPPGDVNLDFKADCTDLTAIRNSFGKVRGIPEYNPILDVNKDGVINVRDLAAVSAMMPAGTKCN
jgi:hypothetical protein